ncbi:MAG: hypothetical protein U9R40_05425 [Synergistota bacterium]|nr:hypothetical protein [Synergistota bacterium]
MNRREAEGMRFFFVLFLMVSVVLSASSSRAGGDFCSESLSRLGNTEPVMIEKHGEPNETVITPVENLHNPEITDYRYDHIYSGLVFSFHQPSQGEGRTILFRVEVQNSSLCFRGLCVGSSRKNVTDILGEGLEWEGKLIYEDDEGGASVNISFNEADEVSKFVFLSYID